MEEVISSLGFPIASVVGLAYYFVQKDKASREDINKIMDNLREDNKLDREINPYPFDLAFIFLLKLLLLMKLVKLLKFVFELILLLILLFHFALFQFQ